MFLLFLLVSVLLSAVVVLLSGLSLHSGRTTFFLSTKNIYQMFLEHLLANVLALSQNICIFPLAK